MKKSGFTLTEVLVTLGIIGVVSAMTIPSLSQNWQKRTYATQLHKVYNQFTQAFERTLSSKNATTLYEADIVSSYTGAGGTTVNGIKEFLHDNFKVVNDCGTSAGSCFGTNYKTMGGAARTATTSGYSVAIADGSAIAFQIYANPTAAGEAGIITVDTNGSQGPNIMGRDLFRMYVYTDGTIDDYNINAACRQSVSCARNTRNNNYSSYCNNAANGAGCFGKLLNDNWEMKY